MEDAHQLLFEALDVKEVTLRNRIVAPPMVQVRPITSPEGIEWYQGLAAGGAGLVIVEATGIPRFEEDLKVKTLGPLVEAIHSEGAKAAVQLFPLHFGESAEPNELSPDDIKGMVEGFGKAAKVCMEAGFDGVEPHGAHGYLINKFFMPDVNQREDEFGGSFENRCRFGYEIVSSIRDAVGEEFIILYRHTPRGKAYTVDESVEFAGQLLEAGVDVMDISPARLKEAADMAQPFAEMLGVPVIAVGGMQDPDAAAKALEQGWCDLVAIGRALIADPQLPNKVKDGRLDEIIECVKCGGCYGHLRDRQPVVCANQQAEA